MVGGVVYDCCVGQGDFDWVFQFVCGQCCQNCIGVQEQFVVEVVVDEWVFDVYIVLIQFKGFGKVLVVLCDYLV